MKLIARRAGPTLSMWGPDGTKKMTQRYEDNKITPGEVEARRRAIRSAPSDQKLGRYFAYRFLATLERDQNRGHHWGYRRSQSQIYCTCGLILDIDETEIYLDWMNPINTRDVDPIILVRGHRILPSQEGISTALIVKIEVINQGSTHLVTAICQECGETLPDVSLISAQNFVSTHNVSCLKD